MTLEVTLNVTNSDVSKKPCACNTKELARIVSKMLLVLIQTKDLDRYLNLILVILEDGPLNNSESVKMKTRTTFTKLDRLYRRSGVLVT